MQNLLTYYNKKINPFISTWSVTGTPTVPQTVTLPLTTDDVNFVVDWGDGVKERVQSIAEGTHDYTITGDVEIKIYGDIKGFQFNNAGDKDLIKDISQWGDFNITTTHTFYGCSNLDVSATDAPYINTNSLEATFHTCPSLTTPDFTQWNTSGVSSIRAIFYGATNFNGNISTWDVSSVNNMEYVFYDTNFNGDISNWNTSSLVKALTMFQGTPFNGDLSNWDVSSLDDARSMFSNATLFNQDISSWDVSDVRFMQGMFSGATSFNQPIGNWDTSNVVSMSYMFFKSSSFDQDISNWNTSNVTSMWAVFRAATSFNQDLSSWDINQVANFTQFMSLTTISTVNYDAMLIAWEAQSPTVGLDISFGGSKYTPGGAAEAARTSLINNYNWTISDGGPA